MQDILTEYKKENGDWALYEQRFLEVMRERQIEGTIDRDLIDGGCPLCSEEKPHHFHRRLVAEYLQRHWGDLEIEHIP
jgi:hypothetical protein